jgi:hypothetical protein
MKYRESLKSLFPYDEPNTVAENKCLDTAHCNMVTGLAAAETATNHSSSPAYDETATGCVTG